MDLAANLNVNIPHCEKSKHPFIKPITLELPENTIFGIRHATKAAAQVELYGYTEKHHIWHLCST
jgi:hypothetical protein